MIPRYDNSGNVSDNSSLVFNLANAPFKIISFSSRSKSADFRPVSNFIRSNLSYSTTSFLTVNSYRYSANSVLKNNSNSVGSFLIPSSKANGSITSFFIFIAVSSLLLVAYNGRNTFITRLCNASRTLDFPPPFGPYTADTGKYNSSSLSFIILSSCSEMAAACMSNVTSSRILLKFFTVNWHNILFTSIFQNFLPISLLYSIFCFLQCFYEI